MNTHFINLSPLLLLIIDLVISTIRHYDRTTWLLEIFPVLIALPTHSIIYPKKIPTPSPTLSK